MERTGISLGAKLTYGKLVQFAGKRGWANPRRSVLAKQHGLSARQTDRYVAELEKVKLIRVQQLGLRKANRYYFLTHSWISFKRSRHMCLLKSTTKAATQESPYVSTPLKRSYRKRADAQLRQRLARILSSPQRTETTTAGIRTATAMNYGRKGPVSRESSSHSDDGKAARVSGGTCE